MQIQIGMSDKESEQNTFLRGETNNDKKSAAAADFYHGCCRYHSPPERERQLQSIYLYQRESTIQIT
jgi:hypothetical protein